MFVIVVSEADEDEFDVPAQAIPTVITSIQAKEGNVITRICDLQSVISCVQLQPKLNRAYAPFASEPPTDILVKLILACSYEERKEVYKECSVRSLRFSAPRLRLTGEATLTLTMAATLETLIYIICLRSR